MPKSIRIAAYNVENLFDRARVLNFANNSEGDKWLVKIQDLQNELARAKYDKPKILTLYRALKSYVQIIEVREKLFSRRGFAIKGIKANGRADWEGWIEFKREGFKDAATANTARILREEQQRKGVLAK